MPKRPEEKQVVEVSYMELLTKIHAHITNTYGSVSAFTKHDDYSNCGFSSEKPEISKFLNYLSIPRDGGKKKVMSVPTIARLFKILLNKNVVAKVEVVRATKIYVEK